MIRSYWLAPILKVTIITSYTTPIGIMVSICAPDPLGTANCDLSMTPRIKTQFFMLLKFGEAGATIEVAVSCERV